MQVFTTTAHDKDHNRDRVHLSREVIGHLRKEIGHVENSPRTDTCVEY
jgi:hypothetical protein